MSLILKVFLISLAFGFVSQAYGAPNLHYIGHATVLIEGQVKQVITDPFFGDRILLGLKRRIPPAIPLEQLPKIDIVLISHTHPDHYDERALQVISPKPVIVLPWGRGGRLRKKGFSVVELRPWETYAWEGAVVTAVPARHMFGHCLGYVIEIDGTKIYYTGDTKLHNGLERVQKMGIDIMLLPYGGYPVLGSIWTTSQAVEAIRRVQPKKMIPIHWGTFDRWWTRSEPESPEAFIQLVQKTVPSTQCHFLKVGDRL